MKKIISILICILLCISLIGCSSENEAVTAAAKITVSDNTFESDESTTKNNIQTEKPTEKITEKATEKTTKKSVVTQTSQPTSKETNTTKNKVTQKSETTKKQHTQAATEKTTTTTTTSEVNCTVTIECKKILSNMDNLKEGHEAYVPSDGIILNTYTLSMEKGATVYDAVKNACSDNGISINANKSSYGFYIAGFNNIDEKDCGGGSGWIYFVNGSSPGKSCSKYEIKNGDNIVFSYTC